LPQARLARDTSRAIVSTDHFNVRPQMMRHFQLLIWAAAFVSCGRARSASGTDVVPLSFYIVSDVRVEGGRYIDTVEFPKLGYIAAAPDLVLKNLKAVAFETPTFFTPPRSIVNVTMLTESVEQFASLTGCAAGKRLLVMLGDVPLTAVQVKERISTPNFYIDGGKKQDLPRIADELKKLVR